MSQHTFKSNGLDVLCGWDRPLQGYFLVIESENQDEPLYSNLYEQNSHPECFDSYLSVLNRFGLVCPYGLLSRLEEDKVNNVGNESTEWN
ncbi:hypothetical protein [Vibrio europaeus]|uniref:hypothetical protein n=1 Tax=Vibrio europaeus TaxID=300876 RepID=UPI00233EC0E8|nr:hypothetical protein [Vibrio europaeus]MDC5711130.1 hypothetical protein [Vibrio europaeus]MDC5713159.1 hypothetical protein [Vibrio europaeus]